MTTLILNLKSTIGLTQAQFEQICQHNQDVQLELTQIS
jgi:Tfp pilus assembly protein PilN